MTRYETGERGEGKLINGAIINAIRTNVSSHHLHNNTIDSALLVPLRLKKYSDCNSGQMATNILKVAQFVPCPALI